MPDETAMLLTQQEWEDLAQMAEHYRAATRWVDLVDPAEEEPSEVEYMATLRRRRALAQRIIDAAEV